MIWNVRKRKALGWVSLICGAAMCWAPSFDGLPPFLEKAYVAVGILLVTLGMLVALDVK